MKFNTLQKVLLLIYVCVLVYISIIHVPFSESSKKIVFDHLFSERSRIDITRVLISIFILTISTGILLYLLRGVAFTIKFKNLLRKFSLKPLLISVLMILIIIISYFVVKIFSADSLSANDIDSTLNLSVLQAKGNLKEHKAKFDSTKPFKEVVPTKEELEKAFQCSEDNIIKVFNSHMSFNYPDWEIVGKPKIQSDGDCSFKLSFFAVKSQYKSLGKDAFIVRISFNVDYTQYYFNTIRGYLF
ncbi:MAG: hypothetical protein ACO1OT_08915 [Heyndrickxia sp.]